LGLNPKVEVMKIEFESECELERILCDSSYILESIFANYHNGACSKRKVTFRQVNLKKYGIPDVVFLYNYNGSERLIVIELKNVPAQVKDFAQLSRYITCLKTLDNRFKITGGMLIDVGEKRDRDTCFLYNELKNNILWGTIRCGVNGIALDVYDKDWTIPCVDEDKVDLVLAFNKSFDTYKHETTLKKV